MYSYTIYDSSAATEHHYEHAHILVEYCYYSIWNAIFCVIIQYEMVSFWRHDKEQQCKFQSRWYVFINDHICNCEKPES